MGSNNEPESCSVLRLLPDTDGALLWNGYGLMPIYEYGCIKCGWVIDIAQSIDKRDEAPKCGDCDEPMKRIVSAGVGAIFKGTGWGKS